MGMGAGSKIEFVKGESVFFESYLSHTMYSCFFAVRAPLATPLLAASKALVRFRSVVVQT